MKQLRKIVKFSSSWTKPTNADELITNFGDFLENTMHISSRSVVYSEIKNLFIDIIENCATLVDYQFNGKGLDPLFLKYDTDENTQESTKSIDNLNGKIFKYLREGYLDRWYGWAAQWWLKDKHSKLNKLQLEILISSFFESIEKALKRKKSTEIRGFGTFFIKEIKEKYSARNPKTGELIYVPKKNNWLFYDNKQLFKSFCEKNNIEWI